MARFEYFAQSFAQRPGGQKLLTFVAPASEIRLWAGVPRKHFDYEHGFQRTLAPKRIIDISDYFTENEENISPTSVIIALKPDKYELVPVETSQELSELMDGEQAYKLVIDFQEPEEVETMELVDAAVDVLRSRVPPEQLQQIDENVNDALASIAEIEGDMNTDEEESGGEGGDYQFDDLTTSRSYLADFYAELRGMQEGIRELDDEEKLRQVLFSLLKPGLIVDGQHRVFGAAAADERIKLAICAVPDATWFEQVFQFVIINQKAKPIKPAFLNAIIATSLNEEEIRQVYNRLEESGIDVERAQLMHRINTDADSPFREMIDFEVEGAPGFLQFPGMNQLVREFRGITGSHSSLVEDAAAWADSTDVWLPHFFALWRGVRDYFVGKDARLWQRPTEANPNNLLKIVALQEIQRLMLDMLADARTFKFEDAAATYEMSCTFWGDFPPTFFTDEWKQKGLQTTVGRSILRKALTETRRNYDRPNWGHRRLGLFQSS